MQGLLANLIDLFATVLGTPVIVLGLVALVGLVAQRKTIAEIFVGTLKTMLGYLVMLAGIITLVTALGPISELFFTAYGLEGFFPQDEAVVAGPSPTLAGCHWRLVRQCRTQEASRPRNLSCAGCHWRLARQCFHP